jgi:hypothetical protein
LQVCVNTDHVSKPDASELSAFFSKATAMLEVVHNHPQVNTPESLLEPLFRLLSVLVEHDIQEDTTSGNIRYIFP